MWERGDGVSRGVTGAEGRFLCASQVTSRGDPSSIGQILLSLPTSNRVTHF